MGRLHPLLDLKDTPNKDSLKQCIAEMKQLVESRRVPLAGPDGEGEPILKPDWIEFNGVGENAHEPFIFPFVKRASIFARRSGSRMMQSWSLVCLLPETTSLRVN